jgi:hypothetical protein
MYSFCYLAPIWGGDPKISGIVTKIYLKYLYKFETLVPFKVLSLWPDTAIPAMLPLLETLSKIFNRNAVKGRQQFSLNLCNVSRMPPFQNLYHPWVQKKSQGARSGFFKKSPNTLADTQKKCQKNWHEACSAMSLGRLVQNIVDSLYLMAEPWTILICAEDSNSRNIWVPIVCFSTVAIFRGLTLDLH